MHDGMQELLEQANEIQESLSRSYAVPEDISEDDLKAGTLRVSMVLLNETLELHPPTQNWMHSKNLTGMTPLIWTLSQRPVRSTLAFSKNMAWYVFRLAQPPPALTPPYNRGN